MSDPNPTGPALTPGISKQARRELSLSQTDVIKACGVQAYKLKQWEGRGLNIDRADIRLLTDFYEAHGVNIAELAAQAEQPQRGQAGKVPALQNGFTFAPRPGFIISDQLTGEQVDLLMSRMEVNDDRIAALTAEAFKTGFFGDVTEDTETKARELIGTLAESHVIFRALQGRNVVSVARDEPKTIGEYLGKMLADSPVLSLIAGDAAEPVHVEG